MTSSAAPSSMNTTGGFRSIFAEYAHAGSANSGPWLNGRRRKSSPTTRGGSTGRASTSTTPNGRLGKSSTGGAARGSRSRRGSPGLFNGYWLTMAGVKIRRVRQSEYGELYRLEALRKRLHL